MDAKNLHGKFESSGLVLQYTWLEQCVKLLLSSGKQAGALHQAVFEQLLQHEICHWNDRFLDQQVAQAEKSRVEHKQVLQVIDINNIGAKAAEQQSDTFKRCLRLTLTDGRTCINAFEYGRVEGLATDMPLGSKLMLQNVDVRHGLLLLHSRNCRVLGGGVAALRKRQQNMQAKHSSRETAVDKERKRVVADAAAAAALVLSPPRSQHAPAAAPAAGRPSSSSAAASAALDADIHAAQAAQRGADSTDDDALLAALLAEEEASGWAGEAAAASPPAQFDQDDGWDDAALEAALLAAEQQAAGSAGVAAAAPRAPSRESSESSDTFSPPARRPNQKRRRSDASAIGSAGSWQSPQVLDVFSSPEGSGSKRPASGSRTITDAGGQQVHVRRQAVNVNEGVKDVNLTQVLDLTSRMDAAAAAAGQGGFEYDGDSDGAAAAPSPPRAAKPSKQAIVDVTCSDSDSSQQVSPPRRQPPAPTPLLNSSVSSKSTASTSPPSTVPAATPAAIPADGWGQPQRFGASKAEPADIKPLASLGARGSAALGSSVAVRCICRDVVGSLQYQGQYSLQLLLADTTGTLQVHVAPALIQRCIGATPHALSAALADKSAPGKARRKDAKGRVRQLATHLSRFVGWARLQRGQSAAAAGSSGSGSSWVAQELMVCFNKQLQQLAASR